MTSGIQLIAGLGNPGPDYAKTRHNTGVLLVEQLALQYKQALFFSKKFQGSVGTLVFNDHSCHLLIPTTYMNLSGQAVSAMANFYKIAPANILIVHDELDLPAGTIRLKYNGGHGGHNGLRNIFSALHSQAFYRLRIGIGKPDNQQDITDYVLRKPSQHEFSLIQQSIENALTLIPDIITGNIESAMKTLHTDKKNVNNV